MGSKEKEVDCNKEGEFAIDMYYPYVGGEKLVKDVSDFLRSRGCEVEENKVKKEIQLFIDRLRRERKNNEDTSRCMLRCEKEKEDNGYWDCASSCYENRQDDWDW
ncbi:MAG: hypothetical protein QXR58_00125 [Candidatus Micrarchaeaceae archaeon]